MRNSKALTHKQAKDILAHHGVETKQDSSGKLMALDCSTYNNKLLTIWIKAPLTTRSIYSFLGY